MSDRELALIKRKQELYSWSWFYTNSTNSLMVSRYTKTVKVYKDGDSERVVSNFPYVADMWNKHYDNSINYSKRFLDDKESSAACNAEILKVEKALSELNKKKD